MSPTRLAIRLVRHHARLAAAGFLLAFLVVAGVGAASVVPGYADHAVRESTRMSAAYADQAVVAGSPEDAEVLRSAGLTATRSGAVIVRSPLAAQPVEHIVFDPWRPNYPVLAGQPPLSPERIAVSTSTAEALGAGVGERVQMREGKTWREVTIAALVTDPADIDRQFVVAAGLVTPEGGSIWLGSPSDAVLEKLTGLASGDTSISRVDARADTRVETANAQLHKAWRALAILLGILGVASGFVVVSLARAIVRADVAGLAASGMRERAIRTVMARALLIPAGSGCALGTLAAALVPWAGRRSGALLGQCWSGVTLPEPAYVAGAIGAVALGLALPIAMARARAHRQRHRVGWPPVAEKLLGRIAAVVAAVSLLLILAARLSMTSLTVFLVGIPLAALAAAVPSVVWTLAQRGQGPLARQVHAHTALPQILVGTILAGLCAVASWSAASRWHTAAVNGTQLFTPMQPPNSIVASAVPAPTAAEISNAFLESGGDSVRSWIVPDERRTQQRVTTASAAACVESDPSLDIAAVPPECLRTEAAVPLNTLMLSDDPSLGARILADADLIQQGRVALVAFRAGAVEASSIDVVDAAAPDPVLGGYLPGAVIGVDSPLARRLSVTPSAVRTMAFLGAEHMTAQERARFIGRLLHLAPTTVIGDATAPPQSSRYAQNRFTSALSALVIGLLLAAVMTVLADALARIEATMAGLRRPPALRRRAAALIIVAGTCGAVCGLVFAWFSGVHLTASFGWTWLWPLVGVVLGVVPLLRPRMAGGHG